MKKSSNKKEKKFTTRAGSLSSHTMTKLAKKSSTRPLLSAFAITGILVVSLLIGLLAGAFTSALLPIQDSSRVYASSNLVEYPYDSYIYKLNSKPVRVPAPYVPVASYTGMNFDIGSFSALSDIYYDEGSRQFFLADSGNSRIVVLTKDMELVGSLEMFIHNKIREEFSAPTGIAVQNNLLYVADSGMSRIIVISLDDLKPTVLDPTLMRSPVVVDVFVKPEIDLLGPDYVYTPTKIDVDYAGRIYVIAAGVNQGLIQLDDKGIFTGFMGAPRVVPKAADIIWRKFYSEEQKKRVFKFVPTEYNSVKVDEKGFLYVSSQTVSIPPISRLNGQGENILKKRTVTVFGGNNFPDGDGNYLNLAGKQVKNYFIDVEAKDNGMYIGLDSLNGKLFAYDRDGLLLYAFGGIGSQVGTFYSPSAFTLVDDKIYVTDHAKGSITVFDMTSFGKSIDAAINSHNSGDYENSMKLWEEVLRYSDSFETADIGIARIEIQNKDFESAMNRLEPIGEKYYYSMAYREYRSIFMKKNFTWIFFIILILVAAIFVLPRFLRNNKYVSAVREKSFYKEYVYGKHLIFHPFDGFWDLKREKKGSARAAILYYALFLILYAVRAQFSGYVVTGVRSDDVNVLYELALIIIPIALFIVSNWSFTTLMDGEGSMLDIFIATGYSLRPYIILAIPLLLMSHFLVGEEITFYVVLNFIAVAWSVGLLVLGMMVTHDYSFSKNLLATILTVIGILLMIFVGLLLANITRDVIKFFTDIYYEITFRYY